MHADESLLNADFLLFLLFFFLIRSSEKWFFTEMKILPHASYLKKIKIYSCETEEGVRQKCF